MEPRHGTKELHSGNALDGRINRRQCVDQTDGPVVAIDVVPLHRRFPVWAGDECWGRPFRIDEPWRERGRIGRRLLDSLASKTAKLHGSDPTRRYPHIDPGSTARRLIPP